ncbi:hypothetical protein F5B18DRAFT_655632 [Nemania serpens]|nr:hypothetical protein F5B18DRAFT_655632 [Nemania serpens]
MNTSDLDMRTDSGIGHLSTCYRCYQLFLPFAGESQARISAAHPDCTKVNPARPLQSNSISIRKARKRDMTQFAKRRKTYIKRTHDLSQDCNAQVYTVIRKNNNFWVYNSHPQDITWPPRTTDIMQSYPVPHIFTPESFQALPQGGA